MSRSDKHTPHWVKARDAAWRPQFVEEHDHRNGRCDLDVYMAGRLPWAPGRCRMTHRYDGRNHYCGCRLCTQQDGRKLARRQERVVWRSLRAEVLAAVDRGEVDVYMPRCDSW